MACSTTKRKAGKKPQIAKPDHPSFRVDKYCKALEKEKWLEIIVRNTAKGKLKGMYYFCPVFVLNKTRSSFEKRLLVIRKTKTKKGEEIKYSFTNANLGRQKDINRYYKDKLINVSN